MWCAGGLYQVVTCRWTVPGCDMHVDYTKLWQAGGLWHAGGLYQVVIVTCRLTVPGCDMQVGCSCFVSHTTMGCIDLDKCFKLETFEVPTVSSAVWPNWFYKKRQQNTVKQYFTFLASTNLTHSSQVLRKGAPHSAHLLDWASMLRISG